MAKLLRITTTENDGTFDNDLDSSFELPPNSTVALQSTNFTFDTEELILERNNDGFIFQLGDDAADLRDVRVEDIHDFFVLGVKEEYNVTNFSQFLKNFEASINEQIFAPNDLGALEEEDAGYEARVEVNIKQKVTIEMSRSQLVDWNQSADAHQFDRYNLNIVQGNNNAFQIQTAGVDDGFIIDRMPWNRGGNFARCRIHNMAAAAATNGFKFGIVSEVTKRQFDAGQNIDDDDYIFAIKVSPTEVRMMMGSKDADPSNTLTDLATNAVPETITGLPLNNHDAFSIETSKGYFQFTHFTTTHPTGVVITPTLPPGENVGDYGLYNPNLNYYVALSIDKQDDTDTLVDMVGAINSPYATRPPQPTASKLVLTNQLQVHQHVMRLSHVPDIPTTASTFQLQFRYIEVGTANLTDNPTMASFLGFTDLSVNKIPTQPSNNFSFISDKSSAGLLKTQTFVIQLVSLPVESYDTVSGKKENTIYTIVENVELNRTQELSFNSQYPIYIQLKNRNPILLRRLKARIVDHELLPIVTHGQSQMTLLFGEE